MIAAMFGRLIAVSLILGWVTLSGVDLREDLVDLSSHARDFSTPSKRVALAPVAHNIIQSANRVPRFDVTLSNFIPNILAVAPILDSRRHFQLHKLFRVFLI
jgi:hypothetical protein